MRDESDETQRRPDQRQRPAAQEPPLDPNDVIPVPVAMEPAEIDERAQVVEALREEQEGQREPRRPRDEDSRMKG